MKIIIAKKKHLVIRMPEKNAEIFEDNRNTVIRMLTSARKKNITLHVTVEISSHSSMHLISRRVNNPCMINFSSPSFAYSTIYTDREKKS